MKKRGASDKRKSKAKRHSRRQGSDDGSADESLREGVLPESLDVVVEFAESVSDESVDDDDRWLHGSHTLALLVQNVLEAISTTQLRVPITGLNHSTKERIGTSRRKLEKSGERDALQVLLFSFEQLCDLVQDVGYRSEGAEESRQFFTETFPEWLNYLEEWADKEDDDALREACDRASSAYTPISEYIMIDDDDYFGIEDL